jgi:HK97 gp10 family phage protein
VKSKSQFIGQKRLGRRLAAARDGAEAGAAQALEDTARQVAVAAAETLRTGLEDGERIARRIRIVGEETVRQVEVRHRAARFVEFGTRFMAARPFLGPAMTEARPDLRRRLAHMLRTLMERRHG